MASSRKASRTKTLIERHRVLQDWRDSAALDKINWMEKRAEAEKKAYGGVYVKMRKIQACLFPEV